MGSLLNVQADVQTSLALFDRVFEYLDLPVEIDEVENPTSIARSELRGEVVFDSVDFSYEDGQPTLNDISFIAEAGSRVALVGETGSGKTTLGYLVARLYDVTGGSIHIDGVDVRELSFKTLREAVGVVSQETYLFHGTVLDNLRFARPDATDEEVEAGCPRSADPRPPDDAARGLQHDRGRARLSLLGGREAAHRNREGDPARPADPRPRRGDERARRRDRARGAGGARSAEPGPHDDRDRPSALDDP